MLLQGRRCFSGAADCLNGVNLHFSRLSQSAKAETGWGEALPGHDTGDGIDGQTTCPVLLVKPRAVNKTVYNQKDTFRRGFRREKTTNKNNGCM